MISDFLSWLATHEYYRQQEELEMIASENYVSWNVLKAYSNIFTNKYSEWYPWKRYYGWQKRVDELEMYTQYLALKIFWLTQYSTYDLRKEKKSDLRHVNVQPLSGSPANAAVMISLLPVGSTILALDLASWWHLSHGHALNLSWKYYQTVFYGLTDKHYINYDQIEQLALTHNPDMIIAWFSAYSRTIDRQFFQTVADKQYQKFQKRPYILADIAHVAWLIAGGVYPSPFPYVDIVTTTTHKTLRWPRWALIYTRNDDRNLTKKINQGVFPGIQWWPHQHILYAKAVAFEEVLDPWFADYAQQVIDNARTLAQHLSDQGRTILTWWTDNHIILMDVTTRWWSPIDCWWAKAEKNLEEIGISINKNLLPGDTRSPLDPSWIRLGTAALTTRWMKQEQMITLAECITQALTNYSPASLETYKKTIKELARQFPLFYHNN